VTATVTTTIVGVTGTEGLSKGQLLARPGSSIPTVGQDPQASETATFTAEVFEVLLLQEDRVDRGGLPGVPVSAVDRASVNDIERSSLWDLFY
jgi:hypothetical protein